MQKRSARRAAKETERKSDVIAKIMATESIDDILELTYHEDPDIRQRAAQQLCPCRVQRDKPEFWERIFELCVDPSPKVRFQILHDICDGSPAHYENEVVRALEIFNRDKDEIIKRRAHKALASYLRTGNWNVL